MPRRLAGSLTCMLLLFASVLFGQRDLGTLTGTITDSSGAAVPNAKITIFEDATGQSSDAISGDSGSFTRPALRPGTYTLSVEAAGFQKAQQKGVIVNRAAHSPRISRCRLALQPNR